MKRSVILACLLVAGPATARPAAPVVVFAASSLSELARSVTEAWTRETGIPVRLQLASTATLARQIREGAACDVFIAAAPEWMEGFPARARYDWLGNELVCVVAGDPVGFDLRTVESLAIANEEVPAGKYARAALAHAGVSLPRRVVYGQSVRDVLSVVVHGGATAGIVYETDAAAERRVHVAHRFPAGSHPPIIYTVGLLTPAGEPLFEALRAPAARAEATKRGFRVHQP